MNWNVKSITHQNLNLTFIELEILFQKECKKISHWLASETLHIQGFWIITSLLTEYSFIKKLFFELFLEKFH